jgi:hypothetical protein
MRQLLRRARAVGWMGTRYVDLGWAALVAFRPLDVCAARAHDTCVVPREIS